MVAEIKGCPDVSVYFTKSNIETTEWINEKYHSGYWKLLRIGELFLLVAVTVDNCIVVHFAEGSGLKYASKIFDKFCKINGFKAIVCFSRKESMVKYLKRFGYDLTRFVGIEYKLTKMVV